MKKIKWGLLTKLRIASILALIALSLSYELGANSIIKYSLHFITMLSFLGTWVIQKSPLLTRRNQYDLNPLRDFIDKVRMQVGKCKYLEKVESEGMQLSTLGELLLSKYISLHKILGEKFNPSELTYSRYNSCVEETVHSMGNNLLEAKNILEILNNSNDITSPQWIDKKLLVGLSLKNLGEVLMQLDELYYSLNAITTKSSDDKQLDDKLEKLKDLTSRTKLYST